MKGSYAGLNSGGYILPGLEKVRVDREGSKKQFWSRKYKRRPSIKGEFSESSTAKATIERLKGEKE